MSDIVMFVGFHPWKYWGLATVGVVLLFIITLWVRNSRLRCAIRAVVAALLLAPMPFGIGKSVGWFPLWMYFGISPWGFLLGLVVYGWFAYILLQIPGKLLRGFRTEKPGKPNGEHS